MVTNQKILSSTLSRVKRITASVGKIYKSNSTAISGNKTLSEGFSSFFKIAETTIQNLEQPSLPIAAVGTTSAGKSTNVNGLVGRRIAPMEKKEMSAGILTLTDSSQRSITIHPTPRAAWETGIIRDLTDKEIYDCIHNIYDKYQRFESKISAPVIDVTGPVEWQRNRSILGLPEKMSVKFIDLPGLKTINDHKNYEVIQKILPNAFCIITMDFNDVDQTRITRLLEEVKDIVKAANGNTDFLLFVLNKVDDVKSGEASVDEKIKELKCLIKEALSLEQEKEIIPFVGRLYYLIQMAVEKDPQTFDIIGYNRDKLKDIYNDCANYFEQQYDAGNISDEEYDTIQDIKRDLRKNREIGIDTVGNFYNICCRISNANNLFSEVKRSINESFFPIVIKPIIDGFNKVLVKLLSDIELYITINRNSSIFDLISEKIGILKSRIFIEGSSSDELFEKFSSEAADIENIINCVVENSDDVETIFLSNRIRKDIAKIREEIALRKTGFIDTEIETINSAINDIVTHLTETKTPSEIVSFLQSQKENKVISIFNGITDVPTAVKKNLVSLYLDPFRSSLAEKLSTSDFVEKVRHSMPNGVLQEFEKAYNMLYELFYTKLESFTKDSTFYIKTTTVEYDYLWHKNAVDTLEQSFRRVRNALSKLTGLAFQREANAITGSIQKYLHKELENILHSLNDNARIQSGEISELLHNTLNVSEAPIRLPEELFKFTSPYYFPDEEQFYCTEIIGYKKAACSCLADKPVYKHYVENQYTYKYGNEVGCYNRWVQGIDDAEIVFWGIINEWLKNQVKIYMTTVGNTTKEVIAMIDSLLDERYKELKLEQENKLELLEKLENDITTIRKQYNKLNYFN